MSEGGGHGGGERAGGPESDISAEEFTKDIVEVGLCGGLGNIFDFLTQLGAYKPAAGGGAPH